MATRRSSRADARARVRIGFYFGDEKLGPGKIALLEAIHEQGSIAAAARHLGLAYRQAWERVESLNRCFRRPVVVKAPGGRAGGGATLTAFGVELIARCERMEKRALAAVRDDLKALEDRRR